VGSSVPGGKGRGPARWESRSSSAAAALCKLLSLSDMYWRRRGVFSHPRVCERGWEEWVAPHFLEHCSGCEGEFLLTSPFKRACAEMESVGALRPIPESIIAGPWARMRHY